MKKLLAVLLALSMAFALVACGGNSGNNTADNTANNTTNNTGDNTANDTGDSGDAEQPGAGKTVGIAMPTQSSERWINDGANMKAQLEAAGYTGLVGYELFPARSTREAVKAILDAG